MIGAAGACNSYGMKGGGMGGRAGPAYMTAVELGYPPCTSGESKDDWRQVDAEGFTFCIPGHWHQVDPTNLIPPAGAWEGAGGVMKWNSAGSSVDVTYPRTDWERFDLKTQHHYYETIAGQRARMWDDQFEGHRLTRAVFDGPGLVLEGSGPPSAGGMHLRVYRTVRFDKAEKK